jgi:thiol-disulfide isomerase/thioredoxin
VPWRSWPPAAGALTHSGDRFPAEIPMRGILSRLAFLAALAIASPAAATPGFAVGDPAPPLTAPDSKGTLHSLFDHAGKWVFLDFCDAWCPPCQYMASMTQATQDAFDNTAGAVPFQYLTLLMESPTHTPSTSSDAAAWESRFGITSVPVLHSYGVAGSGLIQWFTGVATFAVPTGVIIDPAGVIRAIDIGYRTPAEIVAQIDQLSGNVSNPPPPPDPPQPAFLTSGEFLIRNSIDGSNSPVFSGSFPGQLQFIEFGPITGLQHPAASVTTTVTNGVETMDVNAFDFDLNTGQSSDIALVTPWTSRVSSMTWSDGFPRVRVGAQPVTLTLIVASGGNLVSFPTGIVVPDTFVANSVKFGSVDLASVPGRPAHVVGYAFQGLTVAIDTGTVLLTPTSVPHAPSAGAVTFAAPWPNPAPGGAVGLAWSQPHAGTGELDVLDVTGRTVRRIIASSAAPGSHLEHWDLRDISGHRVAPGVYFARLLTEGVIRVQRIAVLN